MSMFAEYLMSIIGIEFQVLWNKVEELKILLNVCKFDILAMTESYLDKKMDNKRLEIENYKFIRLDWKKGKIGGDCLIYISDHVTSVHRKSIETTKTLISNLA